MNAKTAKRLRAELNEACRLDARISRAKLWKKIKYGYLQTPRKERATFTIFQTDSDRE